MNHPAYFSSINVHNCTALKASAHEASDGSGLGWLTIHFSEENYPDCNLSVFMPKERAERIAAAINAVDAPPAAVGAAMIAQAAE